MGVPELAYPAFVLPLFRLIFIACRWNSIREFDELDMGGLQMTTVQVCRFQGLLLSVMPAPLFRQVFQVQ